MTGFGSIRDPEAAEARLERLHSGFRAVSKDIDRSLPKRALWHTTVGQIGLCVLMASALAIASLALLIGLVDRDWSFTTKLKHIAAAPNCSAARAVGLAPARRGQPGYYFRHDRDQDGIACEPWSRY